MLLQQKNRLTAAHDAWRRLPVKTPFPVAEFNLPYSEAADRNKDPILGVLAEHFADRKDVLEIGSGTAQHAVHFASRLPHLVWHCSDVSENLYSIKQRLSQSALPNLAGAIEFDIAGTWPIRQYSAVFTANSLHIMSWNNVERLFEGLPRLLHHDGKFIVYGPFNEHDRYTSESNRLFDLQLKQVHPERGLRAIEDVMALARCAGLGLLADRVMPANNRCLVWQSMR